MTNIIETEAATATILNDHLVLVRARHGVSIDREQVEEGHQLIAAAMPGDYGILIDREADYSVFPVAVFNVLNQLPRLKAIAIIAHRPTSATIAAIDKALSRKPLQVFTNLADAQRWAESELQLQIDQKQREHNESRGRKS